MEARAGPKTVKTSFSLTWLYTPSSKYEMSLKKSFWHSSRCFFVLKWVLHSRNESQGNRFQIVVINSRVVFSRRFLSSQYMYLAVENTGCLIWIGWILKNPFIINFHSKYTNLQCAHFPAMNWLELNEATVALGKLSHPYMGHPVCTYLVTKTWQINILYDIELLFVSKSQTQSLYTFSKWRRRARPLCLAAGVHFKTPFFN